MDKAGIRFSNSEYLYFELDPTTKEVTITAVIDGTALAGEVTLTAVNDDTAEAGTVRRTSAKAAKKMESK